jgi:hypothetical protein
MQHSSNIKITLINVAASRLGRPVLAKRTARALLFPYAPVSSPVSCSTYWGNRRVGMFSFARRGMRTPPSRSQPRRPTSARVPRQRLARRSGRAVAGRSGLLGRDVAPRLPTVPRSGRPRARRGRHVDERAGTTAAGAEWEGVLMVVGAGDRVSLSWNMNPRGSR